MLNIQQAEAFPRKQPRNHQSRNINRDERYQGIEQRAVAMGLELTEDRLEAIDFVLDFYEHCEDCRNARQLMKVMDQEFTAKGGKKYLYRLFPAGPLSQIHELTDLPNLGHQTDQGFGTSY
jgi:tRNA 2-thiouridine synthesizing protein E